MFPSLFQSKKKIKKAQFEDNMVDNKACKLEKHWLGLELSKLLN